MPIRGFVARVPYELFVWPISFFFFFIREALDAVLR